ncbi:hypothetical protein CEUSTIGMA_g10755.t1 [Chlamydomonas eustigma]|uniref:Uncharacterized protein n=1 Tax=Chlamydomonas eustigma TaxID=1157962 RepID=A0A250XK69_9CHLO|nr:hypothetical protein CEUSTIGMA_g10755.t1 [Chlamydomonas eustigma]|eukprot:GAX83329.1 hypothetical protein CEUSTIGMA_g10755.t1 [Chlamydomonas eustigma]
MPPELKQKYAVAIATRTTNTTTSIIAFDPGLKKNVGYCCIRIDIKSKKLDNVEVGVFPTGEAKEYHSQVKKIIQTWHKPSECLIVVVENQFKGKKKLQKAEALISSVALDAGPDIVHVMHARTKDPYFKFERGVDRKMDAKMDDAREKAVDERVSSVRAELELMKRVLLLKRLNENHVRYAWMKASPVMQSGGNPGIVLPSEYFGDESNAYYPLSEIKKYEANTESSPFWARGPIPYMRLIGGYDGVGTEGETTKGVKEMAKLTEAFRKRVFSLKVKGTKALLEAARKLT